MSKIHGNQLAIGDKYQQIKASYGISFLNFVIFEDFPETTHNFIPTHTIYKDCVFKENQMVYIEMPKVQTVNKNSPAIEKLVYLLCNANQMEDDMENDIVFEDPALNQIYEDYLKVTENREFMALLEAKEKFWRDAEAEKDFVEARGLAKGKAEVVLRMAQRNLPVAEIADMVGIPPAEVQKIIAEQV